jgi:hypothetical protein
MFSTLFATRCPSTERTRFCTSVASDSSFAGHGADALGGCADLGQETVDAGRVVAQRRGEALDISERAADRALILGHDLADALEHVVGAARDVAHALHDVLEIGAVGEDRRHRLAGRRRERRRGGVAAGERDRRDAGEERGLERARVSARSGIERSTSTTASTRRGSSGSRRTSVTSPTRMPLNWTKEPLARPATEPENTTRTGWRRWLESEPENQ